MSRYALWARRGLRPARLGLAILFHPLEGSRELRNYQSWTTALVLMLLTVAVRIVTIYISSFHISALQPEYANLFLEVARLILPLVSWSIACYLITAIADGEAFFRDVLLGMTYAMVPYIVFAVPIAALTNIITRDEMSIIKWLTYAVWIWVGTLMIVQIQVLNDYTLKKTVNVTLLSLSGLIIFWAIIGLIYALTNHVSQFVQEVIIEIRYLMAN